MTGFLAQVGRYGFDHMGGWGWVSGAVGLLLIALVVGLIVLLILTLIRRDEAVRPGRKGALALLDERYARGEVEREEYLQRKADLGG